MHAARFKKKGHVSFKRRGTYLNQEDLLVSLNKRCARIPCPVFYAKEKRKASLSILCEGKNKSFACVLCEGKEKSFAYKNQQGLVSLLCAASILSEAKLRILLAKPCKINAHTKEKITTLEGLFKKYQEDLKRAVVKIFDKGHKKQLLVSLLFLRIGYSSLLFGANLLVSNPSFHF